MSAGKRVVLAGKERALLLSFFFFSLASPIFLLFTNTFLWRENASPVSLTLYNIGIYTGVGLGFIANRTLLLKLSARALYGIACLLQGITPLLLVFFSPTAATQLVGLGLLFGASAGLYFANRNFFTSLLTKTKSRFAFLSLDGALAVLGAIISPLAIGWYLSFAIDTQHLSSLEAYTHVILLGLGFLILSALTMHIPNIEHPPLAKHIFIPHASILWKKVRTMDFVGGLVHGIYVTIPLMVALTLLSSESSIGMLQSTAALIGALSIYLIGKHKTKIPHQKLMLFWLFGSLLAGGVIAYSFSVWSVIICAIITGIIGPFQRTTLSYLMYTAVEKEHEKERANLLLDREIFLNIGRVFALIGCAITLFYWPAETLRYGFLCAMIFKIVLLITTRRVEKELA